MEDPSPLFLYMTNKFKIRSRDHLEWVATFPCTIAKGGMNCNITPVHADHLMRAGGHAMGLKECDSKVLPLCWHHHSEKTVTGNEKEFWRKYNISWSRVLAVVAWYKINSPCRRIRNV